MAPAHLVHIDISLIAFGFDYDDGSARVLLEGLTLQYDERLLRTSLVLKLVLDVVHEVKLAELCVELIWIWLLAEVALEGAPVVSHDLAAFQECLFAEELLLQPLLEALVMDVSN